MRKHHDLTNDATKTTGKPGSAQTPFFSPVVQPQLKVNAPGDKYEQEADTVADKVVMRMNAPSVGSGNPGDNTLQCLPLQINRNTETQASQENEPTTLATTQTENTVQREEQKEESSPSVTPQDDPQISRKCTTCEQEEKIQREEMEQSEEPIQRTASGEQEDSIQAKSLMRKSNSGAFFTTPAFRAQLQHTKGTGTPLMGNVLQRMNNAFGSDFSHVRIHTNSNATAMSNSIQAKAFTYGSDIYFNQGQFSPQTSSGQHLLAHELTHVVQQTGNVQRQMNDLTPVEIPPSRRVDAESLPAPTTSRRANTVPATTLVQLPERPSSVATNQEQSPVLADGAQGSSAAANDSLPAPSQAPLGILMPEPPMVLSTTEQDRVASVNQQASSERRTQSTVPASGENVDTARDTVQVSQQEMNSRAQDELLVELEAQPAPSPAIEQLCTDIREAIRRRRPPDEDSLLRNNPAQSAQEAQTSLNGNIQQDTARVQANYTSIETAPTGQAPPQSSTLNPTPAVVPAASITAERAAPDAIPAEQVSLDADVAATEQSMEAAGMNSETAQLVETGPIAAARDEHANLTEHATTGRAEALAQQTAAIQSAQTNMAQLRQDALTSLRASRRGAVSNDTRQQAQMKETEEQKRERISREANEIFTNTQTQVTGILERIPQTAMDQWESNKTAISTEFSDRLAEVRRWIEERHSGTFGGVVSAWDNWTGYPSWVIRAYNEAERRFGDQICDLIRRISIEVNTLIASCERLIANARREVNAKFASLGTELPLWAQQEQARFQERFDGLQQRTTQTRDNFTRELTSQAAQAVQDARQQIHDLRVAAQGILGRIASFIADFINDPFRTIINGLLSLLGISPSAFWRVINQIGEVIGEIAERPVAFGRNLLGAIGAGFQLFFDNFPRHFLTGLFDWLFSGLRSAGVEVPRDFSMRSIFTFFLQLMGISWQMLRRVIGRIVGERNMAIIEQVVAAIGTFMRQGIAGIFDLIKEHFNPMEIIDAIKQQAMTYMQDAIIGAVSRRIAAMFIPGGAILQALEAIYRVLRWVFENAARIFSLIETIVGGMVNIIAGNTAGMATAIERALVRLIAPVIDFLAGFLGFGNLPERIAGVVRGLQARVEAVIERVLRVIARGVMNLLRGARNLGRRAVGAVMGWLGLRKDFTGENGESHTLFFRGNNEQAQLMMASSRPVTLRTWVNGIEVGNDRVLAEKKARALTKVDEINTIKGRTTSNEQQAQAKQRDLTTKLDQLSQLLRPLFKDNLSDQVLDLSFFGTSAAGWGKKMVVKNLTKKNKPEGSVPSVSNPKFDIINQRRYGAGSYYVLGHLLNHNLGGTGAEWKNLTPITRQANSQHENQVERRVKTAVNAGNIVYYEVEAVYSRSSSTATLKREVTMAQLAEQEKIHQIIDEEVNVAVTLNCKAYLINPTNNNQRTVLVEATIPNQLDQRPESYHLTEMARATVYLSAADLRALQTIPGVNSALAGKIRRVFSEIGREGYTHYPTYGSLSEHIFADGTRFSAAERRTIVGLSNLPYVRLYSNS